MHILCGTDGGLRHGARARRRGPVPGDLVRGRGAVPAGLGPVESVVLVTTDVVRDTPPDRHFSAWSRPKPAPDPLPGPSVASGVIPTKGGRNGPVPATSGRAPQGRWRSSPWKRCNHAAPRSRVREHPAPLGALRRNDRNYEPRSRSHVRDHPAPLGALRPHRLDLPDGERRQGAPRTARCIKTRGFEPRGGALTTRQGPPRAFASPAHHLTGGPR